VTLPPSITAPFEALTVPETTPASPSAAAPPTVPSTTPPTVPSTTPRAADEASARRPLLELFPRAPDADARVAIPARAAAPARAPAVAPRPPAPIDDADRVALKASPYETFYGLSEKPFGLSTDPRFFFHSTPHDAVSQQLLTAIRDREGLVVLTGALGAGKTTLCRVVTEELDRRTLTSFVTERFASGEELLRKVLADFGVSRDERPRGAATDQRNLIAALRSFVESLASLEARAVVIVDDAQHQTPEVFGLIRTLCEAAEASSHLQVVLVGQPSLVTLLRQPENRVVQQRVAVRAALEPLPADEIGSYIQHRLAIAGGSRLEFSDEALARIHRLSNGVPRVVNLLCDRALARAFAVTAAVVEEPTIDQAAEDIDLGERSTGARRVGVTLAWIAAVVLGVVIGGGLAAWIFRDAVTRAITDWQSVPSAPAAPRRRLPAPLAPPSTRAAEPSVGSVS
jgi:general secretion pathway protein A